MSKNPPQPNPQPNTPNPKKSYTTIRARIYKAIKLKTDPFHQFRFKLRMTTTQFFKKEFEAYRDFQKNFKGFKRLRIARHMVLYFAFGFTMAELMISPMRFALYDHVKGEDIKYRSWVSPQLNKHPYPIPFHTTLQILTKLVEEPDPDLLTLITAGSILGPISQEYAYSAYYMAHLKDPDLVKGNSELQFEVKGEVDESEINPKMIVNQLMNSPSQSS